VIGESRCPQFAGIRALAAPSHSRLVMVPTYFQVPEQSCGACGKTCGISRSDSTDTSVASVALHRPPAPLPGWRPEGGEALARTLGSARFAAAAAASGGQCLCSRMEEDC